MEAGKAIYYILSNDASVTAVTSLIYGNEAKQGIDFPSIVYNTISDVGLNSKSGMAALTSRVQVDCFAVGYDAANALALLVRASLADKAAGTYNTVKVQNIKFDSAQDLTDSAGFDGINRISMDFIIHYNL